MRRLVVVLLVLVALVALLAGGLFLGLRHVDLAAMVAHRASEAIGRGVAIRALRIGPGNPIVIEADDVTLANGAAGGNMASLHRLTMDLDPWRLLRGRLLLRRLTIEGASVALERDAAGRANWQVSGSSRSASRADFPTILDTTLSNVSLTFRTTSGQLLRIAAASVALRTSGDDAPISLQAEGSYNATPIKLAGTLDSFAHLRETATPFRVAITGTAPAATVSFEGTADDPLHDDGLRGVLHGDLARLDSLLAFTGVPMRVDVPLTLTSPFVRHGDTWTLSALKGDLAGAAYSGQVELVEGAAGQPDRLGVTLDASALKADALVRATSSADGKTMAPTAMSLQVDEAPGVLLDAHLSVGQASWHDAVAKDVRLHLLMAPSRLSLPDATMDIGGGRVTGTVDVVPNGGATAITARLDIARADIGAVLRLAKLDVRSVRGRFDGHVDLGSTANTLGEAIAAAHGQAVLTMSSGEVARSAVHRASSDLKLLFTDDSGMTPVVCFLAVANMHDGVASVSPLRLRTRDGTIVGGGSINLRRDAIDLTIQSVPATTGFLSLDLPIRISGNLSDPNAMPGTANMARALAAQGAGALKDLNSEFEPLASRSGCAR
jgi:uncharacterized protein involved in outer membrane biogenesis